MADHIARTETRADLRREVRDIGTGFGRQWTPLGEMLCVARRAGIVGGQKSRRAEARM